MLFNLLPKSWSFFFLSPLLVDFDLVVNDSAFLILCTYDGGFHSVFFKYVFNKVTSISDAGAFNSVYQRTTLTTCKTVTANDLNIISN